MSQVSMNMSMTDEMAETIQELIREGVKARRATWQPTTNMNDPDWLYNATLDKGERHKLESIYPRVLDEGSPDASVIIDMVHERQNPNSFVAELRAGDYFLLGQDVFESNPALASAIDAAVLNVVGSPVLARPYTVAGGVLRLPNRRSNYQAATWDRAVVPPHGVYVEFVRKSHPESKQFVDDYRRMIAVQAENHVLSEFFRGLLESCSTLPQLFKSAPMVMDFLQGLAYQTSQSSGHWRNTRLKTLGARMTAAASKMSRAHSKLEPATRYRRCKPLLEVMMPQMMMLVGDGNSMALERASRLPVWPYLAESHYEPGNTL